MTIKSEQTGICEYCGLTHEDYDFYKNPLIKDKLRELKKRYDSLPEDEKLYRMENWAVKRGLRQNTQIVLIGGYHKKPEGGTIVMCGYEKLVMADIWLRKLEEQDIKIASSQEKSQEQTSQLPF